MRNCENSIRRTLINIAWTMCCMVSTVYARQNEITITAKAGQTINLQPTYQDGILLIRGEGTEKRPAIVDGRGITVLTGNNQLYVIGKYIIVQNVKILNPDLIKGIRSVVSFRYKKETGMNSTIKNFQFIQEPGQVSITTYSWLEVFGQNNTVTGCLFKGKTTRNPIMHIDVDDDQPDNHVISGNTFTDIPVHPGEALECIRIGLGKGISGTLVKDNVFKRCFGDSETLSSKSSGNKMTGNYFFECRAGISLRGGNNNSVSGNVFYNTKNALRMSGSGHQVDNNYFFNNPIATDNGGALVLMVGGPLPDCNYEVVKNITIESNIFLNYLGLRVLKPGDQCDDYPSNIIFRHNTFMKGKQAYDLNDTTVAEFRSSIEPALVKGPAAAAVGFNKAAAGKIQPADDRLKIGVHKNGAVMFSNCDFGPGFFSPKLKAANNANGDGRYNEIQQKLNDIRAQDPKK